MYSDVNANDPIAAHSRATPSRTALSDLETDRHWTWSSLHAAADRLAAWLVERLGPRSGERVACISRNRADVLILHFACVRAGAIFVPINWRLAKAEVRALIEDAAPRILLHEAAFDVADAPAVLVPIENLTELGEEGGRPEAGARRDETEVATLLYTSGTTGRPKGVMITERAAFFSALNMSVSTGLTARSVYLCDMPLFHTAGLFLSARSTLQCGGTLLVSGGFESTRTFKRLADATSKVTHYFSVPEMAAAIIRCECFDVAALRHLECWSVGGAPSAPGLIRRYVEQGVRMVQGFGMTETGANLSMPPHDLDRLREKVGSCGLPMLTTRMRLAPLGDLSTCGESGEHPPLLDDPEPEEGELWLAGPGLASGYWHQPEATRAAFQDGWFATGDIGRRDPEGFVHIIDRKKDMFISGGENVFPAEVEAALCDHPAVAEAAVVGVPDERWGEVGRAYVVLKDGARADPDSLIAHCAARLGRYKIPRSVIMSGPLPRTASGKVQKQRLRAETAATLQFEGVGSLSSAPSPSRSILTDLRNTPDECE